MVYMGALGCFNIGTVPRKLEGLAPGERFSLHAATLFMYVDQMLDLPRGLNLARMCNQGTRSTKHSVLSSTLCLVTARREILVFPSALANHDGERRHRRISRRAVRARPRSSL